MSIVAIGNFDGLHLGHQALLRKVLELAKDQPSIAYTFTPHPKKVPRLMSDAQKSRALQDFGIGQVVFQEFTQEFSAISPEDFIQKVLIQRLDAKHVVVGPNFAFGSKASGKISTLLREPFFQTHIVEPVKILGQICSSSIIREAILNGDLDKAKAFLGRPYSLTGKVVAGAGRGKQLGFPTANLEVEQEVLPPLGVYLTYSKIQGIGLTNIGRQPTFGAENPIHIETHFVNLTGSLYGQNLEIFLERKIRDEKKFESVEDLKEQIRQDLEQAKICNLEPVSGP